VECFACLTPCSPVGIAPAAGSNCSVNGRVKRPELLGIVLDKRDHLEASQMLALDQQGCVRVEEPV